MEALYESVCLACDEDIEIGDEITYDTAVDGHVHAECVELSDEEGEAA